MSGRARIPDDERFTPEDKLPPGFMDKVRELVAACTIRSKTVPWIAGRSPDGTIVWIDEDVPGEVAEVKTSETLPFHELGEWLRQNEGENYDKDSDPPGTAHYDANGAEKIAVEERGGDWKAYCKAFRPILKEVDDEGLDDLPPKAEWDLRPYQDDDRKLLEEILSDEDTEQAQAEKARGDRAVVGPVCDAACEIEQVLKSTFSAPASATSGLQGYDLEGGGGQYSKAEAGYVAGPVGYQPCIDCVMFLDIGNKDKNACTLVRGTIRAKGHCKHWSAAVGKLRSIVDAPVCAGVAFTSPAGRVLFLKRSADSDHGGSWCFPGGHVEEGETLEQAAERECAEEIGFLPAGDRVPCAHVVIDGEVDFTTFRQAVDAEFEPKLNAEHTDFVWAPFNEAPQPLHPWVKAAMPLIESGAAKVAKAAKRTLYVHRPLTNVDDFTAWAKAQGFGSVLVDPHVTIAWSKHELEWSAAGDTFDTIIVPAAADQKNGDRSVTPLGDKGAVVLRFESTDMQERWQQFRDAGASWDHESYKPHVTITLDGGDVDLSKVEPWTGVLEFGPEVFAPINDKWQSTITEKAMGTVFDLEQLLKADVADIQRDDHGRFAPGKQTKEQIAAHIERAKAFLNSPEAVAVMAEKTKEFLTEHGHGLAEHVINHNMILPAVHAATTAAVSYLGASHPIEAAAVIVAGYAVREVMKATGLTPKNAIGAVRAAGRAALNEFRSPGLLARKAKPAKDSVERALELFIAALDDNTPEQLLAAAKSPYELANDKRVKEGDTHPLVAAGKLAPDDLEKILRSDECIKRTGGAPAKEDTPMEGLKLFVPIKKVDAVQRMVYGTAVDEAPDHTREVFDYDTSKPLFQSWSANFEKLTDGKSLGNIRAMHGKVAAGKLEQIGFDDARKAIDVAGKIVDDAEWKKVEEGVYTGFSIGGAYVKKWKDGELTRYTANPSEISLVDLPCVPTATFSMIKADGSQELRKFKTVEQPAIVLPAEPTAGAIADKATELAKAAGNAADWPAHIDAARAELVKAAESPNPQADAANVPKGGKKLPKHPGKQGHMANEGSGDTKIGDGGHNVAASETEPTGVENNDEKDPQPLPDSAKGKGADSTVSHKAVDDGEVGEQVWVSARLPGKTFSKKADLRQALLEQDAAEKARTQAAPVLDALKGLTSELDRREGKRTEVSIAEMVAKGHDAKVCAAIGAPAAEWGVFKAWLGENADNLAKALTNTAVPPFAVDDKGAVAVPEATAVAIKKLMAKAAADAVAKRDFTDDERKKLAASGAAMKDGSFPIENKDDLKNAVEAHGRSKNKAAAKRHIMRRAKALGATDQLPDEWKGASKAAGDGKLAKGASLYGVSNLLMLIASLENAEEAAEVDELWGGAINISKDLKDRFGQALIEVGDIAAELLDAVLTTMRDEESREAMERAAPILDLMKVGARHSAKDKGLIKQAHDALTDLDKDCCPAGDGGEADKSVAIGELRKQLEANNTAYSATLGEIGTVLKDVAERVRRIEDTPMPMLSQTFRTATKGHEVAQDQAQTPAALDQPEVMEKLAEHAIRLAQQRPYRVG